MRKASRRESESPARCGASWAPSPQSQSTQDDSATTANAEAPRVSVGRPAEVPSGTSRSFTSFSFAPSSGSGVLEHDSLPARSAQRGSNQLRRAGVQQHAPVSLRQPRLERAVVEGGDQENRAAA